jgi:diguanylate cyclase (GGDEF)-like protein/PAS domain S-box-containing protein
VPNLRLALASSLTIRVRLLALVMAVVFPFAVILGLNVRDRAVSARDKAFEAVRQTAQIHRDAIGQFLQTSESVLARLAQRPQVVALDARRCDTFVQEYLKFHPEYANLQLRNPQGRVVCAFASTPALSPLAQAGATPWFDQALAANVFHVSPVLAGAQTGQWQLVLSQPVRNPAGRTVGLLTLPLDVLTLNNHLLDATPDGTVIAVVDAQGTYLMRSDAPQKWIGQPGPVVTQATAKGQNNGLVTATGPDGVVRMHAYSTLNGVNWRVVAGVPEATALAASRQARSLSGWLLSGLTVLVLGLAWRLGSGILKPIKALSRTARQVASGDINERAPVSGPPELAAVAAQFNRMLDLRDAVEDAVREGQARYRALVEWSPMGICVHAKGKLLYVNPAAVAMMGATSAGDLIGRSIMDAVHPDFRTMASERIQRAMAYGTPAEQVQQRLYTIDGRTIDVEIQSTRIQYQGQTAIQTNVQDVTQRHQAEKRVQLLATVFTHAREGILITDAQGAIVEVNRTFTDITGYSREEALGADPNTLLSSGRNAETFDLERNTALATHGYWIGEVWSRRKNGEVFAEILTISAVKNAEGVTQNFVALFTDISQQKQHQHQLEHMAHYDTLTGLPNRVLLADRLQHAMVQSQRETSSLAVAFLDLDGFKHVNDRYGHRAGDEFLVALALRMKAALRDGDTLSRIGGDEFVVVMGGLQGAHDYEPVLERLLQAAADPVIIGQLTLQVSTSIGVTLYPQDGSDADVLLRHADQAMYVAKQSGKNRFHLFDVAKDTAVKTERETLEHIQRALDRDELVLYYQPKVNMHSNAVVGAEALIRWQHPERGLLAPATFLPAIENQPISLRMGEWALATALAQAATWAAQGLHLPVSVNISAIQMQDAHFVPFLKALLARYPLLQAHNLELEILETTALEDINKVSQTMLACKLLGVRFALDDFGTGYSSLTYLKRLPAEVLKIDRSFVHDMLDDREDLAIVQGVIGLATTFKREVIAEGVETHAHGALLLSMGCAVAQGYGISHPMPGTEMPAWIARWHQNPQWMA